MDIKMKCVYKRREKECSHSTKYICSTCQPQEFYCKKHAGHHSLKYKHEVNEIRFDLGYIKKQIKSCISRIAKETDYVISEIRRTSLKAITELKSLNKNVKTLNDLKITSYDTKRISFLFEQASCINQKMDETPYEKIEDLLNLLKEKDTLIASQKNEAVKLTNLVQQKEAFIINQNNDSEKISNLLKQKEAFISNQKNEAERLSNLLQQKEALIGNQKNETEKLSSIIKQKESLLATQKSETEKLSNIINQKESLLATQKSETEKLSNSIKQKETLIERLEMDIKMLNTRVQELNKTQMDRQVPPQSQNSTSRGTN